MFTGIIEELGIIRAMDRRTDSIVLTIEAHTVLEGTRIGDSIAVNGVCLTVTSLNDTSFTADVMHETMRRTSFCELRTGSPVNLERAMQVGGRLGGHIVSGHIDGTGHVSRIENDGIARVITISIDGISLTVVSAGSSQFSVSIIPHTMSHTTLMGKHPGAIVNLETDIVGKYIHRFMETGPVESPKGVTMEMLLENGF